MFTQEQAKAMYDALKKIVEIDARNDDGTMDEWTEALAFCEAQMIASMTIDNLNLNKKEM